METPLIQASRSLSFAVSFSAGLERLRHGHQTHRVIIRKRQTEPNRTVPYTAPAVPRCNPEIYGAAPSAVDVLGFAGDSARELKIVIFSTSQRGIGLQPYLSRERQHRERERSPEGILQFEVRERRTYGSGAFRAALQFLLRFGINESQPFLLPFVSNLQCVFSGASRSQQRRQKFLLTHSNSALQHYGNGNCRCRETSFVGSRLKILEKNRINPPTFHYSSCP